MAFETSRHVKLSKIVEELSLEKLFYLDEHDEVKIETSDINRPGLQLVGYFEYFGTDRIQIFGKVEMTYLAQLDDEKRYKSIRTFFCRDTMCSFGKRNGTLKRDDGMCKEFNVPFLRTHEDTSRFSSNLIAYLNVELAPMVTMHGELVEVYGEGVLILGESGVGKSETALELVKRATGWWPMI